MSAAVFDVHIASANAVVAGLLAGIVGVSPATRLQSQVTSLDTLLPVVQMVDADVLLLESGTLTTSRMCPAQVVATLSADLPVILVEQRPHRRQGLREMMEAGAAGLISVNELSPRLLLHAIRTVASGGRYVSTELAAGVVKSEQTDPGASLTMRERQVVGLIAEGATNRDVARLLGISLKTVKNHLTSAYAKLGVESRQQLGASFANLPPELRHVNVA